MKCSAPNLEISKNAVFCSQGFLISDDVLEFYGFLPSPFVALASFFFGKLVTLAHFFYNAVTDNSVTKTSFMHKYYRLTGLPFSSNARVVRRSAEDLINPFFGRNPQNAASSIRQIGRHKLRNYSDLYFTFGR